MIGEFSPWLEIDSEDVDVTLESERRALLSIGKLIRQKNYDCKLAITISPCVINFFGRIACLQRFGASLLKLITTVLQTLQTRNVVYDVDMFLHCSIL